LSAFMTVGYLDASNEEWCAAVNGVLASDAPPAGFSQCGPSTEVFLPGGGSAGFLVPVDVSHLPPPQSPEWSIRFDLVYDMRLRNDSSLQIAGSWRYSSEVSLVSAGLPAGTLDGVVQYNGEFVNPERDSTNIFDLNVTWRSANENWRVSGYVKNLTDELYAGTGTFVAGLFNFTQMNHPRHWGVEFAYRM
ncbi:MAG: TonB-dependent receptor, partial [Pseudomonadales bacterium]